MKAARVAGLDAATGLHFPNAFASMPLLRVHLPGHGAIALGDASNGLCGGMVFAVRDCFEAHRTPPPETATPAAGTLAYDFLVGRLLDSFDLPGGPARYYAWMSNTDADGPNGLGIGARTRDEVVKIRAALDRGEPCALALIRARSFDPRDLGKNHQVLAFGYDLDETSDRLALQLYDPNHPDADIAMSCSLTPGTQLDLHYSSGEPARGFFLTPYHRANPGPLFGEPDPGGGLLGSFARIVTRLFRARA
jgi:hypothetical protein